MGYAGYSGSRIGHAMKKSIWGLLLLLLGSVVALASEPVEQPAQQVVDAETYLIGAGDVLQIFVWRSPELTTTIPVRPDGKISTPLVEEMAAAGKTPAVLARDIEKVLAEYVRTPTVNVIVTNAVSVARQVSVIGQVRRPQAVAYRDGMTVMDLVLAVGGMVEFAAGNRSKIVRKDGAKQIEIRIRLADLVNDGDLKQNVALRPGDVLVVPQSRF